MSAIKDKVPFPMPQADYYEGDPEAWHVYSWSPTPEAEVAAGKPQAPSTQVHLHIPMPFGRLLFRFKGPGTLDATIDALLKHREDVFGKR